VPKSNTSQEAPSFTNAAKNAGVPIQIKTEDVAELGTVTWVEAEPMTVTLPDGSGKQTEGYFCTIQDQDGSLYSVFIGGMALTRILAEVPLPFKAQIVKSGRTWVFAD
jgi:hypothetical protein